MAVIKVGGEVDSNCTRCKMLLAHTVLAVWGGDIKRVRCNTCLGEHAFRPPASQAPAKVRTSSGPSRAAGSSSYNELLVGRSRSSARPYALDTAYSPGDLIEHPSFGLGVVAATRGLDKIEVRFPAATKTLMHNRAARPAVAQAIVARRADVSLDLDEDEDDDPPNLLPGQAKR